MQPTEGMVRGMTAVDLGDPISVPVGRKTLGRVLGVLGQEVDGKGPVDAEKRMPIHRTAPTLEEQSTETEMFETGIKVVYDNYESVEAIDAMTGVREYLFDYLLSEEGRPEHIIILDAVDFDIFTPSERLLQVLSQIDLSQKKDSPTILMVDSSFIRNNNGSRLHFTKPFNDFVQKEQPAAMISDKTKAPQLSSGIGKSTALR